MYGHFPARAALVMRLPAKRSASRSRDGKSEAERITKPSLSRALRAAVYGSVIDVVISDEGVGLMFVVMFVPVAIEYSWG